MNSVEWGSSGPYLRSRKIASACVSVLTAVATIYLADTIRQDWYSVQEIQNFNKGPPARFVMFIWPYIGTCTGVLLLVVSLVTIPSLLSAEPNPSKQRPEGADTFSELEKLRSEKADLLRHLKPNRDDYKSAVGRMFLFGGIFIAIQLHD